MDEFAALTGRRYHLFDYVGAPGRRARHRDDGIGGGDGATRRWTALRARGEKVGVLKVRLYRPFSVDALRWRRCPASIRAIAVLDRTKEPGALGEPLYLDVADGARGGDRARRRSPRAARRRRPLRAVVQGVHAGDGRRPSSTSCRRPTPQQPLHRRHQRRRDATRRLEYDRDFDIEPDDRVAARLLRPGRGRHGRRQQELDQDHRRGDRPATPRATSSTTRRSRAR